MHTAIHQQHHFRLHTGFKRAAFTAATIGITTLDNHYIDWQVTVIANTGTNASATCTHLIFGISTPSATSGAVYKLTLQSSTKNLIQPI